MIGLRSVGSKPELVSELGVPMMKGMQEYNVSSAAEHFPDHGDVATDSHTGLPSINKTKEELEAEFVPFKAVIASGVDVVMTAHIQYPKVEKEEVDSTDPTVGKMTLPATLSYDAAREGLVLLPKESDSSDKQKSADDKPTDKTTSSEVFNIDDPSPLAAAVAAAAVGATALGTSGMLCSNDNAPNEHPHLSTITTPAVN